MTLAVDTAVVLGDREARALEASARLQLRWDPLQAVRVVTTARALGMFTTPPMGVLAFLAVPLERAPAQPVDVTVALSALADLLPLAADGGADLGSVPEVVVAPGSIPSVLHLPPEDGWQIPLHAVSGDLVAGVEAAVAEFAARTAGMSDYVQQSVAEEIWSRPGWGGLPMRALHAAHRLGLLPQDRSRVSSAANGPWRRLHTVRGQVFTYDRGPAARLALRVVS